MSAFAGSIAERPGWDVTVVAPGAEGITKVSSSVPYNVHVVTCKAPRCVRTRLVRRAFGEGFLAMRLLRKAMYCKPDVIVVSVPSVFLILGIPMCRRLPVVVDLRDLVWEYLLQFPGSRRWVGWLLKRLTRALLRRAQAVSVTNELEARKLGWGSFPAPVVVRNGLSRARFDALGALQAKRRSADTPFHVVYVGNIGIAQGLDTLLDAIGGNPAFRITLVGYGSDFDRIHGSVSSRGFDNVIMTGALPWSSVLPIYADADCLYGQIGAEFSSAVPSKFFEYVSIGRPVVFAVPLEGVAADIMRQFQGVRLLVPGNVAQLQGVLETMNKTGAQSPQVTAWNREMVQSKFLREEAAQDFAEMVTRVLE
ncbi:glycosyltransferase [Thioalkalivibrio sp. ALE11]|uniref:glycosyltransferase n=1 Tax=Thioalkalivibrio sp. ALE11 TaxID=1265494 RepID=UPI0012DF354B|nr:glycosyltransferase [Thioalkalivibrio sp. ALE11]